MKHKASRILVADEDPGQLLRIERLLNRFDYYCIAPIRTFEDLVQLTSNPFFQFDWLIVNQALVHPYGVGPNEFCRMRSHIAHILVYETLPPVSLDNYKKLLVRDGFCSSTRFNTSPKMI